MTTQIPIPLYLWWTLVAMAFCGLLAAALWFVKLALNLLSWQRSRRLARAEELAKSAPKRCPACGRMRAKDGEHECPKSRHAAGMGPYPPRIMEVDPMNPEPKTIQPILFADGYRIPVEDIHKRGLNPIINSDGRIVMVMSIDEGQPKGTISVEDWCGLSHGARIS